MLIKITNDNAAILFHAIYAVTMEANGILGRKGTAVCTIYNDHLFLLSAAHCIKEEDLETLCITNFKSNNPFSIPFSLAYYPYIKNSGTCADIIILHLNSKAIMDNINDRGNALKDSEQFINKIKEMPFFKKIIKKAKGSTERLKNCLNVQRHIKPFLKKTRKNV